MFLLSHVLLILLSSLTHRLFLSHLCFLRLSASSVCIRRATGPFMFRKQGQNEEKPGIVFSQKGILSDKAGTCTPRYRHETAS
jgi:hypothetical protein